MNSKERFEAICNYQIPDKVPVNYLAHPDADKKLGRILDVTPKKNCWMLSAATFTFFHPVIFHKMKVL